MKLHIVVMEVDRSKEALLYFSEYWLTEFQLYRGWKALE